MEEWFEQYLKLTADELGIILTFALPLLAVLNRRFRALVGRLAGRVALLLGRPQERYRRWFLSEYGTLRNIYLNRDETVGLADSYISLSVQAEGETGGAQVPATTVLSPEGPRRIVIVGDPGTGKSTLLKAYGSGILRRAGSDSELRSVRRTDELPILITLRQVADALAGGGTLDEQILDLLAKRTGTRDSRTLFRRLLRQGRIVLLLDGLDEVARPGYEAVRKAVFDFTTADEEADLPTSMARVVITCRRQNFRQLEEDWSGWFSGTSYAIAALRDAEIARFVERRAAQFSDERTAEAFLADVRASGTVDMHRVPLILTISIGLYTQLAGYEIPHSVDQFYDEMVRELLRRHDFRAENQLRLNKYGAEDKHRFLRELALHLAQARPSPFADFTYGEVIEFCRARLRTMPRIENERDFVNEIIDRSGLLSRTTEDGHYAFAHRALHEHLVAAQLARDPHHGYGFLLSKAGDAQWSQVVVLFCGRTHAYVERFLEALAERSLELACHCLATAEVAPDVAAVFIDRARAEASAPDAGHRMLAAIVEAVKSPVPATRDLAFDALRGALVRIANDADREARAKTVANLFGGQSPVAGKVLLTMSRHATPEMATAVARLTAQLPDNEPALVAPLWHCLSIPGIERNREVARTIIGRLLVLAMNEECAVTLDRLPALTRSWSTAEDRATAYPLRRGLPPESNLVGLLALGQSLRMLDKVPRRNLYLEALTEPGRPLALLEAPSLLARVNLHRWVRRGSSVALIVAVVGCTLSVVLTARGGQTMPWLPILLGLGVSLVAFGVVAFALSRRAAHRYLDHIYGARFSRWCYLVPATEPAFGLASTEPIWIFLTSAGRSMSEETLTAFATYVVLPPVYAFPLAYLLAPWPWLIPIAAVPALLLFLWLPGTELCGRYTALALVASQHYLAIYDDPASRHWVVPRQHGRERAYWPAA